MAILDFSVSGLCRGQGLRDVRQVCFRISNFKLHMHVDSGHRQKPIDFQWGHSQNGRLVAILDFLFSRLYILVQWDILNLIKSLDKTSEIFQMQFVIFIERSYILWLRFDWNLFPKIKWSVTIRSDNLMLHKQQTLAARTYDHQTQICK